MAENGKGQRGFEDPEVVRRAVEARRASPRGRRGRRYEDLPGNWEDSGIQSNGRPTAQTERVAIALRNVARLEDISGLLFDSCRLVLQEVVDRGGGKLTMPESQVITRLLDKSLPDLRTEAQAGNTQTTRFVISAPLRRLVQAGATVAGEVTSTTAPAPAEGEEDDGPPDPE